MAFTCGVCGLNFATPLKLRKHKDSHAEPPRVFALLATHIRSQARLASLCACLQSITEQQTAAASVMLSWSAEPELREVVEHVLQVWSSEQTFAVQVCAQQQQLSQFEHYAALSQQIPHQQGEVWVIFSDDDDLWHPARVHNYLSAIQSWLQRDDAQNLGALVCTRHCSPTGPLDAPPCSAAQVSALLAAGGAQMVGPSTPDGSAAINNHKQEYFDFAIRVQLLHSFVQAANQAVLSHIFADVAFRQWIRSSPLLKVFFTPPDWMYFYNNIATDAEQSFIDAKNPNVGRAVGSLKHIPEDAVAARAQLEHVCKVAPQLDLKEFEFTVALVRQNIDLFILMQYGCAAVTRATIIGFLDRAKHPLKHFENADARQWLRDWQIRVIDQESRRLGIRLD